MHERFILCHLIARTLAADGVFMKTERDFLRRAMDRWELTDQEREQVTVFEGNDEALARVGSLPLETRLEILDALADAVLADGHISPHELRVLREIRAAMGFPEDGPVRALSRTHDNLLNEDAQTPNPNDL